MKKIYKKKNFLEKNQNLQHPTHLHPQLCMVIPPSGNYFTALSVGQADITHFTSHTPYGPKEC